MSMRLRALNKGFLGLTLAAGVAATSAFGADKPIKVSVVQAITSGEWNAEITSGAKAAVAALDFPIDLRIVGPSAIDPMKQVNMFQSEAQTGPDAIVLVNIFPAMFDEPGMEVQKQGIRLVWMNSGPTANFYDGLLVSSDPYQMGKTAAGILAENLSAKLGKPASDIDGEAVFGLCVPGLAVLENRIEGTKAGLAQLMPKVVLNDTIETKVERDKSFAAWNQAIRKKPDALIYADACEPGQLNIAKIISDDGLKAASVAYDTPDEIRHAVASGVFPGAVPSNFFTQAYYSVFLAAKSAHDKTDMPKGWLKIPTVTISKTNAQSYIDAWSDPVKGLPEFYKPTMAQVMSDVQAGKYSPIAEYDNPPK